MYATIDGLPGLHTVADNSAAAMGALRSQLVDRAFKRVKVVRDAIHHDFERFVVDVAAYLARPAGVLNILVLNIQRLSLATCFI
jgi:hypothetical protein